MHQFLQLTTPAGARQVWKALTSPYVTPRYLYGLAATSAWRPGAPVTFTGPGGAELVGEVLASAEPHRLSYFLSAGDGQPSTYVTWEILAAPNGSVVRLTIDEPDDLTSEGPGPEAEAAWSEVIARLGAVLGAAAMIDST